MDVPDLVVGAVGEELDAVSLGPAEGRVLRVLVVAQEDEFVRAEVEAWQFG